MWKFQVEIVGRVIGSSIKKSVYVFGVDITNSGRATAEGATPFLAMTGPDPGFALTWAGSTSFMRPITLQSQELVPSDDGIAELIVSDYFLRPELREKDVKAGIGVGVCIFFTFENGKVAYFPSELPTSLEIPFTREIAVNIAGNNFPKTDFLMRKKISVLAWDDYRDEDGRPIRDGLKLP